jgi:hypothetical protein
VSCGLTCFDLFCELAFTHHARCHQAIHRLTHASIHPCTSLGATWRYTSTTVQHCRTPCTDPYHLNILVKPAGLPPAVTPHTSVPSLPPPRPAPPPPD